MCRKEMMERKMGELTGDGRMALERLVSGFNLHEGTAEKPYTRDVGRAFFPADVVSANQNDPIIKLQKGMDELWSHRPHLATKNGVKPKNGFEEGTVYELTNAGYKFYEAQLKK
jgi:hypothetical protein